jgi:hypothetical protein
VRPAPWAGALLGACLLAPGARADDPPAQTLYPIYAHMPGSMQNDEAQRLFSEVARRYHLGPVEVMDIPAPPEPRAPALLAAARPLLEKVSFTEAETGLDQAVAEVIAGGAVGLSTAQLSDLFLYQAIAAQRATWKKLAGPVTQIENAKAREAYQRAAVLQPDRELEPSRFPPLAIASFRLMAAEVAQRPRGALLVKASPSAEIAIDGGPTQLSPAKGQGLAYGEHFVRVEDVGHRPWATVVLLTESTLTVDAPATAPLTLDDAAAAAHARRMAARFALVATLKTGPAPELELALVDAASGARRDASVIPFPGQGGALDAAVMRLDEEARKSELASGGAVAPLPDSDLRIGAVPAAPAPPGPRLMDDPGTWARGHWPLLTAIGVAVGSALVLGIAVATDTRRPQ